MSRRDPGMRAPVNFREGLGAGAPPTAVCIGCGEEKPTHRVGRKNSERACSEFFRSGRVSPVAE